MAVVHGDYLRLNLSLPNTSVGFGERVTTQGYTGFPNGRRLTDDVVDIELQALEGAAQSGHLVQALAAGDKVNANDVPFSGSFPYIPLPHDKAVNQAG